MFVALVFFLYCLSFGGVYTLVPDFSKHLEIQNKGLFFSISVGVSTLSRIWAGKFSDQKGRIPVLKIGLLLNVLSLVLLANTTSALGFSLSAMVYGLSTGINSPVIFAWVTDRSLSHLKGRAFSTLLLAMEIGIGLGGILASLIYQNSAINLSLSFYFMAFTSVLALLFLTFKKSNW
ncbi:MAG: hypothetical protein C4K58_02915 [Flavobacteriaceae bacterium]|nr:MAG: hypothetical protein C4K58_02915 [Flavobacteriaceae bacterium]